VGRGGILDQSQVFGQTGNSPIQAQEKPDVCTYLPRKLLFATTGHHVLLHVTTQRFEVCAAIFHVVLRDALIR
jgi:hypothetical protein